MAYIHKITNRSTGVLTNFTNYRAFLGGPCTCPGPVHGPWAREKPTLGAPQKCQSSPRCPRMQPQRVIFTKLDLPKMRYITVGSVEASHGNITHLGEVQLGKNDPLWLHLGASWGALTNSGGPYGRFPYGLKCNLVTYVSWGTDLFCTEESTFLLGEL